MIITPEDILLYLLQTGQMTFEEYLKAQEPHSETIDRIEKAIKKYETNRK